MYFLNIFSCVGCHYLFWLVLLFNSDTFSVSLLFFLWSMYTCKHYIFSKNVLMCNWLRCLLEGTLCRKYMLWKLMYMLLNITWYWEMISKKMSSNRNFISAPTCLCQYCLCSGVNSWWLQSSEWSILLL